MKQYKNKKYEFDFELIDLGDYKQQNDITWENIANIITVVNALAQLHMKGITASVLDSKALTAKNFDAKNITAYIFDWNNPIINL